MPNFYAIKNRYGNATTKGFAGADVVVVFESKKERDSYVRSQSINNLSVRAVGVREAKKISGPYGDAHLPNGDYAKIKKGLYV